MDAPRRPAVDPLASLPGLGVRRYVCTAGPRDRPFDEVHGAITLALFQAGTFTYRCRDRAHTMVPGSVLLGAPGEVFCCSHEHSRGDECLSLAFAPELLAPILADQAAPGAIWAASALPPRPRIAALLRAVARTCSEGQVLDELALELAAAVLGELAGRGPGAADERPPQPRDRARAAAAALHVDAHPGERLTLADLAAHVDLSPYHFLRIFRAVVGVPPNEYVIQARVRAAAARLLDDDAPVTEVALEVGFGDLSHFTRTFARAIGATPGRYRAMARRGELRRLGRGA
ncbi:MAG: AraC family transcriptional regulator [Nannocystaceae bacterium]